MLLQSEASQFDISGDHEQCHEPKWNLSAEHTTILSLARLQPPAPQSISTELYIPH